MNATREFRQQRRYPAMAGLALACVLATGNAHAQAAVVDLPHTLKTVLGWIAQARQMQTDYEQQIEQLQTLNKQYEQALIGGDIYDGEPGYREKFEPRALNAGVVERCGAEPGNNPVGPQQYDYCVAIVRTENRRFNAMVTMLEDVEKRDKQLKEALAERKDIAADEQGRLESNTNRILSLQSQLQNDVQNSATLMDAYDAALTSLREDQVRAANSALKGESSLPGTAARGIALRVALQAARTRER